MDTDATSATPGAVEEVLKEHYYRVDPAEYFERRLWGIIALADMQSAKWDHTDQASLFGQFRSVLSDKKFANDVPPGETLSSRTMAAIESYSLMQHVIETALRLFVAGQERAVGSSPLTKLLNMRVSSDLRDPIRQLLGGEARHAVSRMMFPPELRHEESEETKQNMRRHLDFLTAWLTFFARFYSDADYNGAQGNNQLKHGATVAPRDDLSVVLHVAEQPPTTLTPEQWNDAAAVINAESVTYVLQERGGKNMTPGLTLRTDNADPATNLAISQIGISIVRSLWQMSQVVAYPLTPKDYDYDYNYSPLPDELFDSTERPPRSITQTLLQPAPKLAKQNSTAQRRRKR